MARVLMYCTSACPYCQAADRLLARKGVSEVERVRVDLEPARRAEMVKLSGRHTVLRKELFAHRRELVLWTGWGLLVSGVNVVIIWYGGYLNVIGRASIGDNANIEIYKGASFYANAVFVSADSAVNAPRSARSAITLIMRGMPRPSRPGRPGSLSAAPPRPR